MNESTRALTIRRIDGASKEHVSGVIEDALLASLSRINAQSRNESIVLLADDDHHRSVAGLTASTSYGWLLIKLLWVDERCRGRGIGRELVRRAELEGRAIDCHAAWLDTSNPEAHAFYRRLGYTEFGVLENGRDQAPADHRRWFMKKAL